MDTQIDTAQRRADLAEIAKKLVLQINEIQPFQWDKHDEKDQAIVLAALLATEQQARREALEEAAKVCREFSKGYDMEWWRETPKTEVYKTACLEMIAQIDRLREGVES